MLPSKTIENNAADDALVLLPTSTLLNDVENEMESSLRNGRTEKIVMDNIDSEHLVMCFKTVILLKPIYSVMHLAQAWLS